MRTRGDSSDRFSTGQLTITVVVPAHRAWARVCVEGEVDLAAETALVGAVERLATSGAAAVHVDIAAVTFAGSTLPNFLARVHDHLPEAALFVCHPTPLHQRILEVTGLSDVAPRCPGDGEHLD